MEKPSRVVVELCRDYVLDSGVRDYSQRDVVLYALSVGAGAVDAVESGALKFVYELDPEFDVMPSFLTVIAPFTRLFDGILKCPGLPVVHPARLLHVGTHVELEQSIPRAARIRYVSRLLDVEDKRKAAILVVETRFSLEDGQALGKVRNLLYCRGIGGFSSAEGVRDRAYEAKNTEVLMKFRSEFQTLEQQALLYRAAGGDYNPIHADPRFANMFGFERPILHGLCTFGICVRVILKDILNNDPASITSSGCRFVSPVIPGNKLVIETDFLGNGTYSFKCLNSKSQETAAIGFIQCRRKSTAKL